MNLEYKRKKSSLSSQTYSWILVIPLSRIRAFEYTIKTERNKRCKQINVETRKTNTNSGEKVTETGRKKAYTSCSIFTSLDFINLFRLVFVSFSLWFSPLFVLN